MSAASKIAVVAVLAFGSATIAGSAAADGPSCFADWSDAAPVVAAHKLVPAAGLNDLARRHVRGDVVRITLCREETRFVYRLLVRQGGGQINNLTVDARQPFAR